MPFPLLAILLVLLALVVLFATFLVVRRWLRGGRAPQCLMPPQRGYARVSA
jgi:hypothetical protein